MAQPKMSRIEEQTTITCDPNKVFDFLKSDVPHITKISAEPINMGNNGAPNFMAHGPGTNTAHARMAPNFDSVNLARRAFDEPAQLVPRVLNDKAVKPGVAPRGLQPKGSGGGVKQFELFIFGEKITLKLKPEVTDDKNKSITFSMIHEDKNKRNTVFIVKVSIKNNTIVWSLQNAGAIDVSPTVLFYAKIAIDLVIKALDGYLQSA